MPRENFMKIFFYKNKTLAILMIIIFLFYFSS